MLCHEFYSCGCFLDPHILAPLLILWVQTLSLLITRLMVAKLVSGSLLILDKGVILVTLIGIEESQKVRETRMHRSFVP